MREQLRHFGDRKALAAQRAANIDHDGVDELEIVRSGGGEGRVFSLRLGDERRARKGRSRFRFVHAAVPAGATGRMGAALRAKGKRGASLKHAALVFADDRALRVEGLLQHR